MSGSSGAGPPPTTGVVRSSALSFVAPAQPTADTPVMQTNSLNTDPELIGQADRLMPAGLKALCDACSKLYPDQPNPLQVTTRLKYWLGGHDPLDYISMYWNQGKPEEQIPPHWHYVSFGLSDLHGDGRVHPAGTDGLSGYGLELTLRVSGSLPAPPLWPAALLQALARYIFTTGNKLRAGDHISWHRSLDGSGSRLRHLLVAADSQLGDQNTPHGTVSFLQVVGCTGRELKAAQRGSGFEVLKLMSEDPESGGAWLVTRPARARSARGAGVRRRGAGAQLAGVCATVRWTAPAPPEESSTLPSRVEQQIKDTLQRGLNTMSGERTGPEGHMSTDSFEMSSLGRALPEIPEVMEGSWRGDNRTEYLDSVHIVLNAEGASLLPLAIDGRVLHGSSFTWRECTMAVSFVPADTDSALHIANNSHLQVLIPKSLAEDMSKQLSSLSRLADSDSEEDGDEEDLPPPPPLPATYSWEKYGVKITVLSDSDFL